MKNVEKPKKAGRGEILNALSLLLVQVYFQRLLL